MRTAAVAALRSSVTAHDDLTRTPAGSLWRYLANGTGSGASTSLPQTYLS
jgi:hypothetical protein